MSTIYAFEKFAKEHIQDLHNTKAQIRLATLADETGEKESPLETAASHLAVLANHVRKLTAAVRRSTHIPHEIPEPALDSKQA